LHLSVACHPGVPLAATQRRHALCTTTAALLAARYRRRCRTHRTVACARTTAATARRNDARHTAARHALWITVAALVARRWRRGSP